MDGKYEMSVPHNIVAGSPQEAAEQFIAALRNPGTGWAVEVKDLQSGRVEFCTVQPVRAVSS